MRRVQQNTQPREIPVLWVVREGGTAWKKDLFFTWDEQFGEKMVSQLGEAGHWVSVAYDWPENEMSKQPFARLAKLENAEMKGR